MATMILSAAGAELGGMTPIPGGASTGRKLGSYLGRTLDASLRGDMADQENLYPEALLQRSAYGHTVPQLYGTMRLAGNIIWAAPVREVISSARSGGGKGTAVSLLLPARRSSGGTVKRRYASFAVALCRGPGVRLERVYAEDTPLDLTNVTYRFYAGDETQESDALMEASLGAGACPAYRGLCYVVFEDFPLDAFGNRLPNLVFELTRVPEAGALSSAAPENAVKAVCLIPGAGEYVYDSVTQTRLAALQAGTERLPLDTGALINRHTASGAPDVIRALDQLQAALPNVEDVSLVVTWFGTSVNAADCVIRPCVEYSDVSWDVAPDAWSCAGYTRATASVIGTEGDGSLRYGGTPSDASVLRCMAELKARGYRVTLYPMIFMDTPGKPWRGRITGTPSATASFFTKSHGYNEFILHYAALAAEGEAHAFIIGSELVGLTAVRDGETFPAVNALVSLAAQVKTVVGASVLCGYAADWSEYHHTEGGRYHLDPLWASPHIDFVGIDAYFPLTDAPEAEITLQDVINGWTSGEGYDFYYTNPERTATASLTPAYAWKNISWWWNNVHVNPGGAATAWVPGGKPIWFTEIGYPSADGASNRPNVFYDPRSSESALPYHSAGETDFLAQRRALEAAETVWGASAMVAKRFVWAWDARPYPLWPDRADLWADYPLWEKGHWLQGKVGRARLSAVCLELLRAAGTAQELTDLSALDGVAVDGLLLARRISVGETLSLLEGTYGFRLVPKDGKLKAVLCGREDRFPQEAAVARAGKGPRFVRADAGAIPSALHVVYPDRLRAYGANVRSAWAQEDPSGQKATLRLPAALTGGQASRAAERLLRERRAERETGELALPAGLACAVAYGDVITAGGREALVVDVIREGAMARLILAGYDGSAYGAAVSPEPAVVPVTDETPVAALPARAVPLMLPAMPGFAEAEGVYAAAVFSGEGASLVMTESGGTRAFLAGTASACAATGRLTAPAPAASPVLFDETTVLSVAFAGGFLPESTDADGWLSGELALRAESGEIILCRSAVLQGDGSVRLSGLIRGAYGTEPLTAALPLGAQVVMLDAALTPLNSPALIAGRSYDLRCVPLGADESLATTTSFIYAPRGGAPYPPVRFCAATEGADMRLRWIPRDPASGWSASSASFYAEATLRFRLRMTDVAGRLLREIIVTADSYLYAAASISADGFAPGDVVTVKLAALAASGAESDEQTLSFTA